MKDSQQIIAYMETAFAYAQISLHHCRQLRHKARIRPRPFVRRLYVRVAAMALWKIGDSANLQLRTMNHVTRYLLGTYKRKATDTHPK